MTQIEVSAIKAAVVFKAGALPKVNPMEPVIQLKLGDLLITAAVNPKAVRRLAEHRGGAALQGRLVVENGKLRLANAGFQWFDPQPATTGGYHRSEASKFAARA
jgi:hypothetical protein